MPYIMSGPSGVSVRRTHPYSNVRRARTAPIGGGTSDRGVAGLDPPGTNAHRPKGRPPVPRQSVLSRSW